MKTVQKVWLGLAVSLMAAPLRAEGPAPGSLPASAQSLAPELATFDLARSKAKAARAEMPRLRLPARSHASTARAAEQVAFPVDALRIEPPAWTWQAGKRGPVIELGALGGTLNPRPGMAHLALDWQF